MNIQILPLTLDLLIQNKNSYFETLSTLVLSTPLPDHECKRILGKLHAQQWSIQVAVDGNTQRIVWTCSIYIQQKISKWGVLAAQIEEIAVHPDAQWNGIWSALLESALQYSREQWCYKAILNCEEHNIDRYKKFGFEQKEVEMKIYL